MRKKTQTLPTHARLNKLMNQLKDVSGENTADWGTLQIGRMLTLNLLLERYMLSLAKDVQSNSVSRETAERLLSELLEMASLTMSISVLLKTLTFTSLDLSLTSRELNDAASICHGYKAVAVSMDYYINYSK